jgi:hypothetical protein
MYQIEFSGHELTVSSEVLEKKEGNIKASVFLEDS